MRIVKSFDLFQKTTIDKINQPTLLGALLSITSFSIIIYLIFKEINDFFTKIITKDSIVLNENKYFENINDKFYLNITIDINTPCSLLSYQIENLIGTDSDKQIFKKIILDKSSIITDKSIYLPHKLDLLEESIMSNEVCRLNANLLLNKSPGDIHFSFNEYIDVLKYLENNRLDLFNKLNLSHKIIDLSIGNIDKSNSIYTEFNLEYNQQLLPIYAGGFNTSYDYYIIIVPYLLTNEKEGFNSLTYIYTITYKNSKTTENPNIMINYDISPIAMKLTIKQKDFLSLVTHLCAILGGVLFFLKILNRLLT